LLNSHPVTERVDGSPYQPGDRVRVVQTIDPEVVDLSAYVGRTGQVEHLEYDCGCGQSYPADPMIGVRFDDGNLIEFWHEELEKE